jgi:hypothetical protein
VRREQFDTVVLLTAGIALGCGDGGPRESGGQGSGIGSITATDSSPDSASEGQTSDGTTMSGTSQGSDTGPMDSKFDLGLQPDLNSEIEEGCTKVDFVFVIDNSGSMGDDQDNLTDNFGAFIDGIQATLQDVEEYQVGVVTSDVYDANPNPCRELGGLVIRTDGDDSSNATCGPYAEGYNFMTQQDDLAATFACAAQVGTDGSGTERPMNALEIAVRKDLGGPGQCNEGFLRDDALLVAVIITDEWDGPNDPDDGGSSGDHNSWYQTVVAAKGGIVENVVVLSLINYAGGSCPPEDSTFDGQHIAAFTKLFGANGFLGGICEPDYGPIFEQATTVIANACNNFVPPD